MGTVLSPPAIRRFLNEKLDELVRALSHLGVLSIEQNANNMMDPTADSPFSTFQDFQVAFERAFGAADRGQRARTEMAALKMKPSDTVEDYTTAFEALSTHTGYNEAAHIEAYRSGLLHRIVERIYSDSDGNLPADLAAWKTKARRLDSLHHEFKSLQTRGLQTTPHHQGTLPRTTHQPVPSQPWPHTTLNQDEIKMISQPPTRESVQQSSVRCSVYLCSF